MILKNQSIDCFLLDSLIHLELVKASLKKCADSAMILGKLNQDLLTLRRDSITPELPSRTTSRAIGKTVILPLQKQPRLSSLDPSEEADFRKQVNLITGNLKIKKDSFTAGSISNCMESWREITSDKWILQTVSKGASIELEDLASIPLSTAYKTERLYSDSEKMLFGKEICRLLQKGVISK